jgi:hypothetical protein
MLALIVCGGCSGGADQQQGVDAAATWCASPFGAIPVGGSLKDGCTINRCATGAVLESSSGGCTCDFGGRTYEPYETFSAGDGCNTCSCEGSPQDLIAVCTQKTCLEGGPAFDASGTASDGGDAASDASDAASSDGGAGICPPCDADARDCDAAACGD